MDDDIISLETDKCIADFIRFVIESAVLEYDRELEPFSDNRPKVEERKTVGTSTEKEIEDIENLFKAAWKEEYPKLRELLDEEETRGNVTGESDSTNSQIISCETAQRPQGSTNSELVVPGGQDSSTTTATCCVTTLPQDISPPTKEWSSGTEITYLQCTVTSKSTYCHFYDEEHIVDENAVAMEQCSPPVEQQLTPDNKSDKEEMKKEKREKLKKKEINGHKFLRRILTTLFRKPLDRKVKQKSVY